MKDKDTQKHLLQVCRAFDGKPKTILKVAFETGIPRANVSNCVQTLLNNGAMALCKTDIDTITGQRVGFYSTDSRYFPVPKEARNLSEFDIIEEDERYHNSPTESIK